MHLEALSFGSISMSVPFVEMEMIWLEKCIRMRLDGQDDPLPHPSDPAGIPNKYAEFLVEHACQKDERLVLALALTCQLRPGALLKMLSASDKGPYHGIHFIESTKEFVPTMHAVRFLAGELSPAVLNLFFSEDSKLAQAALDLRHRPGQFSDLSATFTFDSELLHELVWNRSFPPKLRTSFPAHRIHTPLTWKDLVIPPEVQRQIDQIDLWLKHGANLDNYWEGANRFKPGFRVLFYGPPGTGKTLAASLLGKENGMEVYRVDLSQVVSKYIGETEKQLKKVFDTAEGRNWVLFFDEADSLFGKRGKVSDSRDRYANQEVSYLLQRIEDFNGLTILATNFKDNMDHAFIRRFQSVIRFVKPGPEERLRLWQATMPAHIPLASNISLEFIARKFELTGADIVNVVQFISLRALAMPEPEIRMSDIIDGIQAEFSKDNRLLH